MRFLLLLLLLLSGTEAYCQGSTKINQIDSLVSAIRSADLPVQRDSVSQEFPELGLSIKTYLTIMLDVKELKKFVSKVKTVQKENGILKEMITATAFYFDHNKIIKVEEFSFESENEQSFAWYYAGDKCLYHTLQSDKAASRALLLVNMANSILKQYIPKN